MNFVDIISARICPYCGTKPSLVDSAIIYGKSYGKVYLCLTCGAYVGCHHGTMKPLGRLANKSLRRAKQNAHLAFDALWQSGKVSRYDAYTWLAAALGIPREYAHIGMLDEIQCHLVMKYATEYMEANR